MSAWRMNLNSISERLDVFVDHLDISDFVRLAVSNVISAP